VVLHRTDEAEVMAPSEPARRLTFKRVRASFEYRITSQSFRMFERAKRTYHGIARTRPKATVFIFGCQRSGTTHLERLFRSDPRSVVFGEFSPLSIAPDKTVWPPLDDLRRRIQTSEGGYAVVRSLLASHRAGEALDSLPGARAVWVFRDPEEVVASMLRKWRGGFEAISRRVESDADGRWELEQLWNGLHAKVAVLSEAPAGSEGRLRDLYAIYWHARNASYFAQGFENDARIRLLDYRTLLERPAVSVGALTEAIGVGAASVSFPLKTERIHAKSTGRSRYLSPEVKVMCDALIERLRYCERSGQ
jgi:hypothetical protein